MIEATEFISCTIDFLCCKHSFLFHLIELFLLTFFYYFFSNSSISILFVDCFIQQLFSFLLCFFYSNSSWISDRYVTVTEGNPEFHLVHTRWNSSWETDPILDCVGKLLHVLFRAPKRKWIIPIQTSICNWLDERNCCFQYVLDPLEVLAALYNCKYRCFSIYFIVFKDVAQCF